MIAGFARVSSPDFILREEDMARELDWLGASVGIADAAGGYRARDLPDFLDDEALHKAARTAYLRDYMAFGFDK